MMWRYVLLLALMILSLPGGGQTLRAEAEGEPSGPAYVLSEALCVVRASQTLAIRRSAQQSSQYSPRRVADQQPLPPLLSSGHRLPNGDRAPLRC
jgi:hypothetical protein